MQKVRKVRKPSKHIGASRAIRFLTSAIITLIVTILILLPVSAHADNDDEAKQQIKNHAQDYIVNDKDGQPDLNLTLRKVAEDTDPNTFGYILNRLVSLGYLNETPQAIQGSEPNCQVNHPYRNTPLYHNCDVPNIATELAQTILGTVANSGPVGAEKESAYLGQGAIGLPSVIPNGGAHVIPQERVDKYTALELYGYNLRYTSYLGEYDSIRVLSSARAMSNFGVFDNIKLAGTTVVRGVANSVREGATAFVSGISSGDIIKAFSGFFSGYEAGVATSVNTILDTSERNVFDSYGWYRTGYGQTLYGARELTNTELSARAKAKLIEAILGSRPDLAQPPADLVALADGIKPAPKDKISSCTISGKNDSFSYGVTDKAPGPSQEECEARAKSLSTDDEKYTATWDASGTQKEESLQEWVNAHQNEFNTASGYGITCTMSIDESSRHESYVNLQTCWAEQYPKVLHEVTIQEQERVNTEWSKDLLSPANMASYFLSNPDNNYNAPFNRYICLDDNDIPLTSNGQYVYVYDSQGNVNPQCSPVRPPIQGGAFGSGYVNGEAPIDTRHVNQNGWLLNMLYGSTDNPGASFGLTVSVWATRISNAVLNLAFTPVLETLGLDSLVVSIIENLRDSIFFPLLALIVTIVALTSLIQFVRTSNAGFKAVITSIFVAVIAVATIINPSFMVKAVDKVPSYAERVVLSSVLSVGATAPDELCTVQEKIEHTKVSLNDDSIFDNPVWDYPVRTILCENWRTFVFTPWVYGQWGTGYGNLYSAESGEKNTLKNSNGNLVGDASVYMGGGVTEKNWALYQLDVMTSGTASYQSSKAESGVVDKDFYRIVDAQAGPDNGYGTDSTHFKVWNGQKSTRGFVSFTSMISGVLGAVVMIFYGLTKVQISFVSILMLAFLPFMLLASVHSGAPRGKFKSYAMTLVGLMIQRIFLVLILAVMLRLLSVVTVASTGYIPVFITVSVLSIIMLRYRKEILDRVMSGATRSANGVSGALNHIKEKVPGAKDNGFVANKIQMAKTMGTSATSGAIGGLAVGGVSGAFTGARQSVQVLTQKEKNRQRRAGFKVLDRTLQMGDAGSQNARKEFEENELYQKIDSEITSTSFEEELYQEELAEWENAEDVESETGTARFNSNGEVIHKPVRRKMSDTRRGRRAIKRIAREDSLRRTQRKPQDLLEREDMTFRDRVAQAQIIQQQENAQREELERVMSQARRQFDMSSLKDRERKQNRPEALLNKMIENNSQMNESESEQKEGEENHEEKDS